MAQKTIQGYCTTTCEECGKTFTGWTRGEDENGESFYEKYKKELWKDGFIPIKITDKKLLKERYRSKNSWIHFCGDCKETQEIKELI